MKELYLEKPNTLQLRDVTPLSPPKDNEAIIKVIYGGICGSDLRVYKGSIPYAAYPVRPGHELLGIIVAKGKDVPYEVGTKAVVMPNTFCGDCEMCRSGKTNICLHKTSLGIAVNGGFAEEFVTDAKYIVPVPDNMPNERAVLIEPLAVSVHALKKVNITQGTSVVVVGCGTEGLLAAALAHHMGGHVTVLDVNPLKLELARRLGNVKAVHPREADNETFDVVIEAAGVKVSIEQSMQLVKPGGSLVLIGITGDPVSFPAIRIVRSEITIYGTIIYTLDDFSDAIHYLNNPDFNVKPVLSKILSYKDYQQAYDDALSGNFAKIVLNFREG